MKNFRTFLTLFILCLATIPALAQRAPGGISFLDTSAKATRSNDLVVNPAVVSALEATTGSVFITGVPLISGSASDFILRPADAFAKDARFVLMEDGGTTRSFSVTPKQGWFGIDPAHPNRAMFISAGRDAKLHAMITGDTETSVTVIQATGADANTYQIVPNHLPEIPLCGESPEMPLFPGAPGGMVATRAVRSTTMYDIELTLDISHDLYTTLGSNSENLVDYLVDLVGAMNIIYHRDLQLNWVVNNLYVWNTPDNFSAPHPEDPDSDLTTGDQLYNYRDYVAANRGGVHFDITHLLDAKPLGGLAYVDVLQGPENVNRQYRSSVSNVYATDNFPADINEYYWDTMVISHELGHNVGSPHTHCYTPPIDCCAVGCSGCSVAAAAAGTIMSYCHLWIGDGGSMQMFFHSRCIALMRPLIESSPLLTIHTSTPLIEVFGAYDTYIASGSSAGTGGTLNSSEVGGPVISQTFKISNPGDLALNLTGTPAVSISGSPLLTTTAQPAVTSIAPGASTTFVVQYNPSVNAPVTATVSIPTNIASSPNYSFQILGQIVEPGPPVITTFDGNESIAEGTGFYTVIPIVVNGITGKITDVDVKFNGSNCANPAQTGLEHPRIGDVQIALESPDGTRVVLMELPGLGGVPSTGANLCNTVFDDGLSNPRIQSITAAGAPYTGTYRPFEPLSAFNGKSPNGTWQLLAYDWTAGVTGSIHSVSLSISGQQPAAQVSNWALYY